MRYWATMIFTRRSQCFEWGHAISLTFCIFTLSPWNWHPAAWGGSHTTNMFEMLNRHNFTILRNLLKVLQKAFQGKEVRITQITQGPFFDLFSWCGEVMGTLAGCAPMACLGAQITADVERSWALWLAEPQWPQRSEYLDFVTMGWRDNKILWQISFLDKSNMVHKCSPILLYLVCFCP